MQYPELTKGPTQIRDADTFAILPAGTIVCSGIFGSYKVSAEQGVSLRYLTKLTSIKNARLTIVSAAIYEETR